MERRVVAFSILGALCLASPAAAQRANRFEFSAAGGYNTYGSATELEAAPGFAVRLGYWFYGPLSVEGEFNYAQPGTSASGSDETVTVSTFAGWLLGNLPVGSSGSVFLKGGYGTTSYGSCPDVAIPGAGPCGAVGVLQGGAGARIAILPTLQFRVDGIINTSLSSRKFSNALVQGGLSLMIGGSSSKAPDPRSADPDGDGVPDRLDRCPGTTRGAKVDAVGCSHDADGDLVPDGVDACPDTPAAATVDSRGCSTVPEPVRAPEPVPAPAPGPPQSPQAQLPAPVTPAAPAPVTPAAPPAPADTAKPAPRAARARVVILPGTIWNYRSSGINATGLPGLDSLVATLKENPSLVAEVQGYAHDRLVPSDNSLLSKRRAEAIKSYIVSKGVTVGRVTAVGLGSQTLLVADTTDAARITNRRVEVHITTRP